MTYLKNLTLLTALLVFVLWLPFGFQLIGLIEEWGILGLFTQHGVFFISSINSPLAYHAIRPLIFLPQAIAYFLDPDSFNYWHVLLIVSLIVKGVVAGLLFWQATGLRRWAMMMAIFMIIYPADTMQLSMRSLHINWSLSLLLVANTLFIAAYRTSKLITSYLLATISAVILWMAIAMYEAALPLSILFFLITYVRDSFKANLKGWWTKKDLLVIWLFSITLYLAYVMSVAPKVHSYQSELLNHVNIIEILMSSYRSLFNPGLMRSLIGGWYDAIRILLIEISLVGYLYISAVTILLVSCMNYLLKKFKTDDKRPICKPQIIRLGVVSLLLILLGYAPYLLSLSHQSISQRTFLFASFGASFFWVTIFVGIAEWKRNLAMVIASIFIFIGLGAQLYQFHHYILLSKNQQSLLRNIVANYDLNAGKENLILIDQSMSLGHTWMLLKENLELSLNYLYGYPFPAIEICQMPGNIWRSTDAWGRYGSCSHTNHTWIFRSSEQISKDAGFTKQILDQHTSVLIINPDGSINNNEQMTSHRNGFNQDESTVAKRYRNMLIWSKWPDYFNVLWAKQEKDKIKWSFGNWWSLELPIRGSGWREAEWTVGNLYHHASAWKTQENAILLFNFIPLKKTYLFHGKFDIILSNDIRDSIKISINNHLISYDWIKDNEFSAQVPAQYFINGINNINFYSKINHNYYDLSVKLASFEISKT